MKCDFCDAKATVFLTQLVEGQAKKVCLCEKCADERGVTDPTGFSLADMILGGLSAAIAQGGEGAAGAGPPSGRKCPACGFTLEDLQRVRRFGCAECYSAFRSEILPMLRGLHRGTHHVGKVPEGLMAAQLKHQRLQELRDRLGQAVAAENYEEAAGLRDEILTLSTPS